MESESARKELALHAERVVGASVVVFLFVTWIQGNAVSTDQFVFRLILGSILMVTFLSLRLRRSSLETSERHDQRTPVRSAHKRILWIILFVHASILSYGAFKNAPTYDEVGHMVAGLSHWRFAEFDLYRVNPPLVRLLATAPVLFIPHQEDWQDWDQGGLSRQEFSIGRQFIKANGEHSVLLFSVARLACIPFSCIGAWCCHILATRLYGVPSGNLAFVLWCFSPTVLGHAQLMTPDVPASALGLLAAIQFVRWRNSLGWVDSFLCGLATGLAMSAKSTWIVLLPFILGYCFAERLAVRTGRGLLGLAFAQGVVIVVAALWVVGVFYAGHGLFERLGQLSFRSELFTGITAQDTVTIGNRFKNHWLGSLPSVLPSDYVVGIDQQRMDFEYTKPGYLAGQWKQGGWWYYYLYAACVKIPVGYLALAMLGLVTARRTTADELAIVSLFVLLALLVSSQTGISNHFRYILPALPLLFVLSARVLKHSSRRFSTVVWMLCVTGVVESLCVVPHSISFFNMVAGGPKNAGSHLLHSNVSWGQDLSRIVKWQQDHVDRGATFYAALHTLYEPSSLGLRYLVPNEGFVVESVENTQQDDLLPGWYAVDIHFLYGYPYSMPIGNNERAAARQRYWIQFRTRPPVERIGYSTFVYFVPER